MSWVLHCAINRSFAPAGLNLLCVCYFIRYQGHALAKELAARGLQTTVITDSAVFAMISRVNMVCDDCIKLLKLYCSFTEKILHLKVIVGAHAVMANGGVIAPVGLNMVALAAQRHAVPFVVLAGVHKVFCPRVLFCDSFSHFGTLI